MSNRRKGNNPREKDSEWQERVIQVKRVTKVCKGGKKISFRAVVVLGNEKGKVGVGVGKAADVIGAVKKAVADGKRHVVSVTLTKNNSVPHISNGIAGAAKVFMRPAAEGCGVIAGGSVRTVLELAGVKNILTKQLGSNNPLNNACATVDALKNLRSYADALENRKVLA